MLAKTPPPTFGWTPTVARLRNKTYTGHNVVAIGRIGLEALPPELWQAILHFAPIGVFWECRSVCRAWKAYIESYLLRRLLQQTSLFLQVDTRPSFDLFSAFIPQESVGEHWLAYRLPPIRRDDYWWDVIHIPIPERIRLANHGKALTIGGTPYGIYVSVAGYLGDAARALHVRYDEKTRVILVDWRVLLGAMFAFSHFKYSHLHLSELIHHPSHADQSALVGR